MTQIVSITHNDLDGVVSSILVRDFFLSKKGADFTKIPCTYKNIDDVFKRFYNESSFYVITDISLTNENVISELENKKNVLIIDHHEREFPSKIQKQYLATDKGSASLMTFNYFTSKGYSYSDALRKLAVLADDYDCWHHKYKMSKNLNRLFYFYWFKDFFERFKHGFDGSFLESEKRFLLAKQREIDELLRTVKHEKIADDVAFVFSSGDIDEIAESIKLTHGFKYVIVYNLKGGLSFRSSRESTFDLSKFLNKHGGGGHKHAGGVAVKGDEDIERIVEDFCNSL